MLCPSLSETILRWIPLANIKEACVWRRSWSLTCAKPALSAIRLNHLVTTSGFIGEPFRMAKDKIAIPRLFREALPVN